MPYVLFHDYFPDLAKKETRTITVVDPASVGLPVGQYALLEMFCDEPGCDCRRVFFSVMSSPRNQLEAVVTYGWEPRAFYARWMKYDNDPLALDQLKGPALNLGSPESELAPAILKMITNIPLRDSAYVERIKRHYLIFRDEVERRAAGARKRGGRKKSMGRPRR